MGAFSICVGRFVWRILYRVLQERVWDLMFDLLLWFCPWGVCLWLVSVLLSALLGVK